MGPAQTQSAFLEARRLKHLFGADAEQAIERRVAHALNAANVDTAMFLLDVQTALYGLPVRQGADTASETGR